MIIGGGERFAAATILHRRPAYAMTRAL